MSADVEAVLELLARSSAVFFFFKSITEVCSFLLHYLQFFIGCQFHIYLHLLKRTSVKKNCVNYLTVGQVILRHLKPGV